MFSEGRHLISPADAYGSADGGFLLAPTACAILGKREAGEGIHVWELLTPRLPLESLVHGAYGIGLTTGVITILITGLFYRKWSERSAVMESVLLSLSFLFFSGF